MINGELRWSIIETESVETVIVLRYNIPLDNGVKDWVRAQYKEVRGRRIPMGGY